MPATWAYNTAVAGRAELAAAAPVGERAFLSEVRSVVVNWTRALAEPSSDPTNCSAGFPHCLSSRWLPPHLKWNEPINSCSM